MTANNYEASVLFKRNYMSTAHIVINQGGTSSGKTYAIEQVLFCLACEKDDQVITVVGQDMPNLKAGALRDALTLLNRSEQLKLLIKNYNKTDRIFEFHNGSVIEFKSYSNAQDAKSGKRDYLFINEANGVEWNIFNELALRTKTRIFIDYNPNSEFWVHDNLIGKPGVELIISDHRHNPFLDKDMADRIEDIEDPEEWRVYARGLTGKVKGLVFKNWFVVDSIPPDATLIAAGLDFGFSNDETGCIEVYKQNGELWIDEMFYDTGLTNKDIADRLQSTGVSKGTEIIADSAEPKSIEELRRLGWYITPAKKGGDSINNSIDILKRYKLNITRRSTNLRAELGKYKWKKDRSGKTINQPVDTCNHLIDPLRAVINVSDATLEATTDLFESQFAPTLNRPYTGGTVAQIKMIDNNDDGNDFNIGVSPRILIDQKLNLNNKSVTFTDGSKSIMVNDWISTPYFYKPDGDYNLCFSDMPTAAGKTLPGLKTKYYPELEKILQQTKKVVRYFLLTPRDILELDLLIPVYIEQDSTYYYINKIDAWRKGQPTKVELIKLG